jgi:hypothetical protein
MTVCLVPVQGDVKVISLYYHVGSWATGDSKKPSIAGRLRGERSKQQAADNRQISKRACESG